MINKVQGKKAVSNRKKRNIIVGNVSILATFNNTIVSVSDSQGNVISWSSAGKMGFKGSKKSTPYAAQITTADAVERAREYGLQTVDVVVRGPGIGRESSLRALQGVGLAVTSIVDNTYYPHNGCRPPKRRRR